MASMITNQVQSPRERRLSRQENDVLLLSPTNLPTDSTWNPTDPRGGTVLLNANGNFINGNSSSFLPSEPTSSEKTRRISLMDKMKSMFKKERVSHSADRPALVSITGGHKHSKTYATSSDSSPRILENGLGPFGKGTNTRRISDVNSRHVRDVQGAAQKLARNSCAPAAIQQSQRSTLSVANSVTNSEHLRVTGQDAAQKQARNSWAPVTMQQTHRSILSIANPDANCERSNVAGRCSLDLSRTGIFSNNADLIKATKNGGLTNTSKSKFKSSLQLFTNFVKSKRDRHGSECSSGEKTVIPDSATAQGEGKSNWTHYNTVGVDDYRKITAESAKKIAGSEQHTISPQNSVGDTFVPIQNYDNSRPAVKTEKKNRFTVKSIKRDITMETEGNLFRKNQKMKANDDFNHAQRKGTAMSRLLKSPDMQTDFEVAYNTVGPQDNRDRRRSVTLSEFLEMYKERAFKGGDVSRRPQLERKRSNSHSEAENLSQRVAAKLAASRKITDLPVITITPVSENIKCNGECANTTGAASNQQDNFPSEVVCLQGGCDCNDETVDTVAEPHKQAGLILETQLNTDNVTDCGSQTHICSNYSAMVADTVQQHTIPEHTVVHHESPPTIAGALPATITKRKNRFEQSRGFSRVVNVSESQLAQRTYCLSPCHRRTPTEYNQNLTATSKGCVTPPRDKNSVYDHSLTVSGYPRGVLLLPSQKGFDRRMSEPYANQQKWPEIKGANSFLANDEVSKTRYKKVSAVSLGIDIPSDGFNNKVLIWIDKGATKILPLPQMDHDFWGKNADGNAAISILAKRYKCYDVMPPSSKLVLFDSELSVTSAFDAFTFNRVRSAPIWDAKKKQLTGMLTVSDFIQVLLICEKEPELFGKITTQKISDWKNLVTKTKLNLDRNMYIPDDGSLNDSTSTGYDSRSDAGADRPRQVRSCRCSPMKRRSNGAKENQKPATGEETSAQSYSTLRTSNLSVVENERSVTDQTEPSIDPTISLSPGTNGDPQETVDARYLATESDDVSIISSSDNQLQNRGSFQSTNADNLTSSTLEDVRAALEPTANDEDGLSFNDDSDLATTASLTTVDDGDADDFDYPVDGSSFTYDSDLISVAADDNLFDAIHTLKTFGFHRVLVMNYEENDPMYILTYKRILYFIYVMMDTINIPPFMSNSIKELNVGNFTNLVTIKYSTSLKEALWSLQSMAVSAIPVVDDGGKVVDLYTKEDVMNLVYNDMFTELNATIADVLKTNRRIFEGLFKCKQEDSLMTVVQYFVDSKAHRLVVTDDENRLQGIVSLSDVVNFMVFGWESDC